MVRLTWTPPRGEFHKFSLRVHLVPAGGPAGCSADKAERLLGTRLPDSRLPEERWLLRDATEYVAEGLLPGERYQIMLTSMTDMTKCLSDDATVVELLTKPLPPSKMVVHEECDRAEVAWDAPLGAGHSSLVGFTLRLRDLAADKIVQETFVEMSQSCVLVLADLASVCRSTETAAGSDKLTVTALSTFLGRTFVTLPRSPTNLRAETCHATALTVKWDPPLECSTRPSFHLTLRPLRAELAARMGKEMVARESDSNVFTFSRLPEVLGTGQAYEVAVEAVVSIAGKSYYSSKAKKVFLTRPLPPDKLVVLDSAEQRLGWRRSRSPAVVKYKVKIKAEEERATDFIVEDTNADIGDSEADVTFLVPVPFQEGVEYKINLYSLVEHEGQVVESEPCHTKVEPQHTPKALFTVQAFREFEDSDLPEPGGLPATARLSIISLMSPRRGPCTFSRQSTFDWKGPRPAGPAWPAVEMAPRMWRQVIQEGCLRPIIIFAHPEKTSLSVGFLMVQRRYVGAVASPSIGEVTAQKVLFLIIRKPTIMNLSLGGRS
jgi:hypothetical protein